MSFACKTVGVVPAVVAAILAMFVTGAWASAPATCPSGGNPAPGSTVTGGLEVDGFCQLKDVTVKGGVMVDPTPTSTANANALVMDASRVDGGVRVGAGSSLSIGVEFVDVFTFLTGNSSTIDGGISLADSGPFDILAGATVHGGLSVAGDNLLGLFMCGSRVYGNVVLDSLVSGVALLGDPEEDVFDNGTCAGNSIHGSIALANSNFILPFNGESNEIEGDTVSGSVQVNHSTAEAYGNMIGGSLLCMNNSVIQPPGPVDPTTNTVHGTNTCF